MVGLSLKPLNKGGIAKEESKGVGRQFEVVNGSFFNISLTRGRSIGTFDLIKYHGGGIHKAFCLYFQN